MPKKKWKIKSEEQIIDSKLLDLAERLSITPLTARLLSLRGLSDYDEAYRFLSFADNRFYNPFLLVDMDKAVKRVESAIASDEKIVIYGDYDVDGVTSTVLLFLYLKDRGVKNLSYYIPGRVDEGYGINREALRKFANEKTDLVITVDTGVTAIDEITYANELGLDFVITDHHECKAEIPNAAAVVNPMRKDEDNKYPFKSLAGVGVAFKLVSAMEMNRLPNGEDYLTDLCKHFCDLVALGTIADVMPLFDENRLFVSMGLKYINDCPRPAVKMLLEEANRKSNGEISQIKKVNSSMIGYTLAPRINAAGRMEHASLAVELFLSENPRRTREIAAHLCDVNRKRQEEENQIAEQAVKMIERDNKDKDSIIVLAGEGWNSGVIGIVASRITEKYGLPSILISFDGDVGKGSGRSVKGVNLFEKLKDCSELLAKFGGHELAAGLTIERKNLDAFCAKIKESVSAASSGTAFIPELEIECETFAPEITIEQAEQLQMLEPYGSGNPMPLFLLRRARVTEIAELAVKHTKLTVKKGTDAFSVLLFGKKRETLDIVYNDEIDIVFQMSVNEFRGYKSVQLIASDFRHCDYEISSSDIELLADIKNGSSFSKDDNIIPQRENFVAVYNYLKHHADSSSDRYISIRNMINELDGIGYVKMHLILEILIERGLVSIEKGGLNYENAIFAINSMHAKVNLTESPIYINLLNNLAD